MPFPKTSRVLATSLAALAAAQTNTTTTNGTSTNWEDLCDKQISNANASGIFPFSVHVSTTSVTNTEIVIPDPAWAITVTSPDEENRVANTTIWYDRAGQNYFDDTDLQYDACAFFLIRFPENTIRLAQDDNGDCTSAFTSDCISNLTKAAALSATTYNGDTTPGTVQTPLRLNSVCSYIAGNLGTSQLPYPSQCQQEFGISAQDSTQGVLSSFTALTSNSTPSAGLYPSCPLSAPNHDNRTFDFVRGITDTYPGYTYDNATRALHAILTVYFPNDPTGPYQSWSNSSLRCVRARDVAQGSREPEKLPSGQWWRYGRGFGKGAIAGIVVGVVVAVGLLGGAAWWCLRRRRRAGKVRDDEADAKLGERNLKGEKGYTAAMLPEADDAAAIGELSPEDRKPELASAEIVELSAKEKPMELGSRAVYELSGTGKSEESSSNR